MRIDDLSPNQKQYIIETFDGDRFNIDNNQREAILKGTGQFFAFKNGEVLNKSSIKMIVVDREKTKELFLQSPEGKKLLEEKTE